jgi:hypothetical protein
MDGSASAVISFIFAIHQLVNLMADSLERRTQISELERTAATQQDQTDYDAAWNSLSKAKELAESGGQFSKVMGRQDRETRQVNVLQENLAMAWMEDVDLKPGQKFSDIIDRIEPILQEGAASATSGLPHNVV